MRIHGVIFDKDGTLFDFQASWGAWTRTILHEESRGDAALAAQIAAALGFNPERGEFLPDSVMIGHTSAEVAAEILRFLPGEDSTMLLARLDAGAAAAPQQPVEGLRDVLHILSARGLRLGVATNDSEAPARTHLQEAGVGDFFDFIAGHDSGHGSKPEPGQLLAFAHGLDLDPAACVMVGDSLHDLHAARAAGMAAVGVLTGIVPHDTLAPMADVVLESILQLPDWLEARG